MNNSPKYSIEPEIIEKIKLDLYHLIRRYCKSYKITDFEYELFLHDSTRIEYTVMEIAEVERFISIVNLILQLRNIHIGIVAGSICGQSQGRSRRIQINVRFLRIYLSEIVLKPFFCLLLLYYHHWYAIFHPQYLVSSYMSVHLLHFT